MKLVRTLALVGVGLSAVGAIAMGCSGSTTNSNSDAGTGEGGGQDAGPSITPPAPSGQPTPSTTTETFAVDKLFLGDTDRMGNPDMNAWATYGYNLDGKITTAASKDVCTLGMGAMSSNQVDGNGGIDNSFGENILTFIQTLLPNPTSTVNKAVAGGSFTLELQTVGLSADPAQTNTGLTAQLFAGTKFPGTPTFTTADDWPVSSSLLKDMMTVASGSQIQFPTAYVTNGTWVNGTNTTITLSLSISGISLNLTIHDAIITFVHSAPDTASNGVIAGVLNTQELITELGLIAGTFTKGSVCPNSATFKSLEGQILQASDIMTDGTNMAGTACDGISIGLGFEGAHIGNPDMVAFPACAGPDPCNPEAGAPACDAGPPPVDSGMPETSTTDGPTE